MVWVLTGVEIGTLMDVWLSAYMYTFTYADLFVLDGLFVRGSKQTEK